MKYKGFYVPGKPVDRASRVTAGDVFVCLKGQSHDGHRFIPEALRRGASLIITEKKMDIQILSRYLRLKDARIALAELSNLYYHDPSKKISLTGITGTNGKTTISYLIRNMLHSSGIQSTLIGTNAHYVGTQRESSQNTTPGHLEINKILARSVAMGILDGVMEVSSHALVQKRTHGMDFNYRVFSNITAEHLDYHKSMKQYIMAKKMFFKDISKNTKIIINADDPYADKMISGLSGKVLRYGIKAKNTFVTARSIRINASGMSFDVYTKRKCFEVTSSLIGYFNVYNILAAICFGLVRGLKVDAIIKGVRRTRVPGRLERIRFPRRYIYIDYAHTHDALENVLKCLKSINRRRLLVVFGCGGDRDPAKREKMGRIAAKYADGSIITNDNPRTEDPKKIAREILRGFGDKSSGRIILDRAKAIEYALRKSREDDLILIAGKRHERGQIVGNKTIPFNDASHVRSLRKRYEHK